MAADPTPPAAADDWGRVGPRVFDGFRTGFVCRLMGALNTGLLDPPLYARLRRPPVPPEPDAAVFGEDPSYDAHTHAVALAVTADQIEVVDAGAGHRPVAGIVVASPGNKFDAAGVGRFVGSLIDRIEDEPGLVLIDLFPPERVDSRTLHGELMRRIGIPFDPPPDKPLCAVGYRSGPVKRAYAEPFAVGDPLPTVPLFLTPDRLVHLPLGPSYAAAKPVIGYWWEEALRGERELPGR